MKKALILFLLFLTVPVLAFNQETALTYDLYGYQEHATNITLGSQTGDLDSNAASSSLHFLTRLEMPHKQSFFGLAASFPVLKTIGRETWQFNGADLQRNDFSCGFLLFDLYGGHTFSDLIRPYGGFRYALAEQVRENFYQNNIPLGTPTSVERIESFNVLLALSGERKSRPMGIEYLIEALYPLSVATTNNLLPGFSFTAPGYSAMASGGLVWRSGENSKLKLGVLYRVIHYDGSGWQTVGTQTAMWPLNDTQDLGVRIAYSTAY